MSYDRKKLFSDVLKQAGQLLADEAVHQAVDGIVHSIWSPPPPTPPALPMPSWGLTCGQTAVGLARAAAAQRPGWTVTDEGQDVATVKVPHGGRTWPVMAAPVGANLRVMVPTWLEFEPGGVPPRLPEILLGLSQRLVVGGYERAETADGLVTFQCRALTPFVSAIPGGVSALIELLVASVAQLRAGLRR